MKTLHTATPWETSNLNILQKNKVSELIACTLSKRDYEECKANAAYIVKCVNEREEILGRCRRAIYYLKNDMPSADAIIALEEALKLAEGGPND